MLSIKVLGPGCRSCQVVEQHAIQAMEQIHASHPHLEVTLEKVSDPERFFDYQLLATPGLVVNEKLVSAGRIPSPSEILAWLDEEAGTGEDQDPDGEHRGQLRQEP